MSQTHNCAPLFSFFECEQQARIKRNLVIQACMRGTMRAFAQWLRVLVLRGARWARGLAAKQRLRSAVRELQRLDDRMLADIGVTRGQIESAVRDGLPIRMMRTYIVLAGLLFFPGPAPADEAESIAALCARRNLQALREAQEEMTVRDTAAATGIKESTLRQLLLKGLAKEGGIRCGG
jgi:uncharacterized protein YjiS (DUF1127 family)